MSSLAAVVPVAESVDTLLAGASAREPIVGGAGKSGARLERVMIDGQRYVVKYLHLADDWTMRAAGDLSGAAFTAWRRGLLARLPDCINQPIVGVCKDPGGSAVLMRDVSQWLVPVTDEVIPLEQHLRFLDHMAAMHAAFWDAGQEVEVIPVMHRYLELSMWIAEAEATIGSTHLVPRLIGQGWALLGDVAPRAAAVAVPLSVDPGPLVEALWRTPQTFVHGNWKLDNLGTDADGRTVLLDWELPGRGAALSDLAWYLAINGAACRRRRKKPSMLTAGHWSATVSTPRSGGTLSSRCACLARSYSSAGRRRSAATTTSWPGGRQGRSRGRGCSREAVGHAEGV